MLGILYCQKSRIDHKKLSAYFTENGIKNRCLAAEELTTVSLTEFSLLLNSMDTYYPEEELPLLVSFFHQGGHIIHLCPTPFTVSLESGQTNHRALRSFTVVDDFHPVEGACSSVSTWYGKTTALSLHGLTSAVYHLCEQEDRGNRRIAHLEHLADAFDSDNNLLAAAVLRIVTHNMGSMTLCNFDVASALTSADTAEFITSLLLQTVRRCLAGTALLTIDAEFSRFTPEEQKLIHIKVSPLTIKEGTKAQLHISICKTSEDAPSSVPEHIPPVYEICESVTLPYEASIMPVLSSSGLYRIEASLSELPDNAQFHDSVTITSCTTGILVLTEDELLHPVSQFTPFVPDETISTDYCVRNGEITAILGTTYFVTDVYRECFYHMNAWLCAKEMKQLHSDGFNVLRSGNWYFIPEFYNADGSIGKRGRRAMETYFYLAAKNDFMVQFALGTVLLNQWDVSRSPIHDTGMRQMCMNLVRSFAKAFREFKNVQMDIVNEPSYSNRGAWSPGKPSLEAGELLRYRDWLKQKYGTIQNLRTAWHETALVLHSFDDVVMPENDLFYRGLARTEQRLNHVILHDFFCFAREEFSAWTGEIRRIVRETAPGMVVIMGRDETLRIPEQQTEVLTGNIDMVCWHQWNYNSDIFTEYLMNRVRGKVCVAQELGMYKFDDILSGKRHTDEEMRKKLSHKLLCAFGNFVQWQAHDDPFMWELSENSLGIYRADHSPTPSLAATRTLIKAERIMQPLMKKRREEAVKICTVYGTSYHYNIEHPFALQGMRSFTYAMFHELKELSGLMLEHLFRKENASAIGTPGLIILPGMQMLSKDTWHELLSYAENGSTLLIHGCIDKNACFAPEAKIGLLDQSYFTRGLHDFECIEIDGIKYSLDFRRITGYADVSNLLDCGDFADEDCDAPATGHTAACLRKFPYGKGCILYCPYPLELSDNTAAVAASYRSAIRQAQAANTIFRARPGAPGILLNAAEYEKCTVYTFLNDGPTDTVTFTDLRSGVTCTVTLDTICSGKLWLSDKGDILQIYGNMKVNIL